MKFKKHTRVEVLDRKEYISGVWHPAEIISCNRYFCNVRYDYSLPMSDTPVVEKVSRKAIRPSPPVHGWDRWAVGDVVEVFDDHVWKSATIVKVSDFRCYNVRLLDSSKEFQIQKVNIRVRQQWQDNIWTVISQGVSKNKEMFKKTSGAKGDKKLSFPLCQANPKINIWKKTFGPSLDETGVQESHIVSSRSLKRSSPFCSSYMEGGSTKIRAVEDKHTKLRSRCPSSVPIKLDAITFPPKNSGETIISHNEMEWGKPGWSHELFNTRTSELSDSDQCSVGSCSVISSTAFKLSSRTLADCSHDADSVSSNAESFRGCEDEQEKWLHPSQEDMAKVSHRSELHAYNCTLKAFYASGPLSWEREALLTSLRLHLHISNDEHLSALKKLISLGSRPLSGIYTATREPPCYTPKLEARMCLALKGLKMMSRLPIFTLQYMGNMRACSQAHLALN